MQPHPGARTMLILACKVRSFLALSPVAWFILHSPSPLASPRPVIDPAFDHFGVALETGILRDARYPLAVGAYRVVGVSVDGLRVWRPRKHLRPRQHEQHREQGDEHLAL